MNILYINHYAGSPEMGMEYRPYYLAREWVKMGHHVSIIAGDYSHLRKKNPAVTKDMQGQTIDGIDYYWMRTGSYEGNGFARALTMERFVRKLYSRARRIVKDIQPEIVIASSTYPLDTYPAQRIASLAKAKYIHEFHDLWPATLYEVGGMSRKHPFVIAMQIAENSACRHCDSCVSLAPYAKDYLVEHGLNPNKFNNIQNGVVVEEWRDYETMPEEHRQLFDSLEGKFIVGYFGGHALSNALDLSLDVAKRMRTNASVEFVFVGDGVEKQSLMRRAAEESLINTHFLPPVNKKAIPDLLRHFDCSYMTGAPSPLYRFGLCLNKMYDSMMAGLPIICAFDAPDTLVRQYDCGYQCSPSNADEVIRSIEELCSMSKKRRFEMGERGRQAIFKHFTYEKLARKFAILFRN
jgi:glycosyltransferase involved in cell wall biosynthesis